MLKRLEKFNNKITGSLIYFSNRVIFFFFISLLISFSVKLFAEGIFLKIKNKLNRPKIIFISNKNIDNSIDKFRRSLAMENIYFNYENLTENNISENQDFDIIIDISSSEILEKREKNLLLSDLESCLNYEIYNNQEDNFSKTNSIFIFNKSKYKIAIFKKSKYQKLDCFIVKKFIDYSKDF